MAHFAKIGLNGKVIAVHAVNNSDILNADGIEDETVGQQFLERLHNWPDQMWIQTSYNTQGGTHLLDGTPFRGNYAGLGYTCDEDNNIFHASQKPYPSWVLNTTTAWWESPIGNAPSLIGEERNTHHYEWNESDQSWDKTENS